MLTYQRSPDSRYSAGKSTAILGSAHAKKGIDVYTNNQDIHPTISADVRELYDAGFWLSV